MKFYKDVDTILDIDEIPDELIDKVFEGKVTFLGGAGVSIRIGFPSFRGLTKQIFEAVGESEVGESVVGVNSENSAFEKGEYDRALGLLEKRICFPDCKSKIRNLVSKILAVEGKKVPTGHKDLLRLSRDSKGRIRLGTTNFDCLFEHAAGKQSDLPSHVLSTSPRPNAENDFGIIHLHGRVEDKTLELPGSELILTSADFGIAYMREGWVPLYLEDRLREGPLVLVGYSAEDAAMRILLDAIGAVRIRLKDINEIYALDLNEDNAKEKWAAKGIKLIGFENRDLIYDTLNEWANYNSSPVNYISSGLENILKKYSISESTNFLSFCNYIDKNLKNHEFQQLEFYLNRIDSTILGKKSYVNINWILYFIFEDYDVGSKLLIDRLNLNIDYNLIDKISPYCLSKLDIGFANNLKERLLKEPELNDVEKKCLQLFIYQIRFNEPKYSVVEWNELLRNIDGKDLSDEKIDKIIKYLYVGIRLLSNRHLNLNSVVPAEIFNIRFITHRYISRSEFFSLWNDMNSEHSIKNNYKFLEKLTDILEKTFEIAKIVGLCGTHGELITTPNERVNEDYNYRKEYFLSEAYFIMSEAVFIWDKLVAKDESAAIRILENWVRSEFCPIYWGAIYGAKNSIVSSEIVYRLLKKIQDYEFYVSESRSVVRRLIKERFKDLRDEKKDEILDRIQKGPPSDIFYKDPENMAMSFQFDLIDFMISSEIKLNEDLINLHKKINIENPRLRLYLNMIKQNESDDVIANELDLDNAEIIDELIDEILMQRVIISSKYIDDWKIICKKYPKISISGLRRNVSSDSHYRRCWELFFQNINWIENIEVLKETLVVLDDLNDDQCRLLYNDILIWFKKNTILFFQNNLGSKFWKIISRFEMLLPPDFLGFNYNIKIDDYETNSWIENLADIFGIMLSKPESLNQDTLSKIIQEIKWFWKFENEGGQQFKVRMSSHLLDLYKFYPEFTIMYVIPLFKFRDKFADKCWEALAQNKDFIPQELFLYLKDVFLRIFEPKKLNDPVVSYYVRKLVKIAISNFSGDTTYSISNLEIREALRKAGAKFLSDVAIAFQSNLQNKSDLEKRIIWKSKIVPVFNAIWPPDIDLHVKGIANSNLIQLVAETGNSIIDAANLIVPYLRYNESAKNESVNSLSALENLSDEQILSAPKIVLEMLSNVIGENPVCSNESLSKFLERVQRIKPEISDSTIYHRLNMIISRIPKSRYILRD